jgi:hypothetical protein
VQTIVLFHRLELTDLFAPVGKALEGKVRIVHLAYSGKEAARLRELGVIEPITVFKDEVRRLHPSSVADATTLSDIDDLFIRQSRGAFNLNGAIQSDRGFTRLSIDEAQCLTVTYHRFWKEFLALHSADSVLHETCSLMFNFVAAMHCAERGAKYLYAVMAEGPGKGFTHLLMSGFDFTCPDLERALAAVDAGKLAIQERRCVAFLEDFRSRFSVFLGEAFRTPSLARVAAASLVQGATGLVRRNKHDRVLDNIDYWEAECRPAAAKFRNLLRYRREVRFDAFDPKARFYFYPLHLEPEAVVLYHAQGIYANQVKLVQNIAAQLPPGVLLYVKDHPHDQGYRSADDYLALQLVPNIRLLDASLSGKEVTAHSLGVITLTGTAGFEALLQGKQVFTFGKTFYSAGPGVTLVQHIRDLRGVLYSKANKSQATDNALHRYLTAYFAALHPGHTDFFGGRAHRAGIDMRNNASDVAAGLMSTLEAGE